MDENRIEEFTNLRQEILEKDNHYHEYKKYSCTATTAILAFALTQNEPFICLIPLAIIIPLYLSCQESMRSIVRIGAYLRVFYDEKGFHWEQRNMFMTNYTRKKRSRRVVFFENSLPYISLVIICCLLSLYKILFNNQFSNLEMSIRLIIVFASLAISIMIISTKYIDTYEVRSYYISIWNRVKKDEIKRRKDVRSK